MLWDEVRFGRYYDLGEFNVVSCRDFNAGAMENKGLNIFNEALIRADPALTTDDQYERIRGVLAHEYFHNWSGDRVTVRDWFQLTLKEGFTVFRDQLFTQDITQDATHDTGSDVNKALNAVGECRAGDLRNARGSAGGSDDEDSQVDGQCAPDQVRDHVHDKAHDQGEEERLTGEAKEVRSKDLGWKGSSKMSVKRLRDIEVMESVQFTQDAGALSHSIRPNRYSSVENLYTLTVYEKGAEVVRMYETLMGPQRFRRGCDLFFRDNDFTAATCEDFRDAMKTAVHGLQDEASLRSVARVTTGKTTIGRTAESRSNTQTKKRPSFKLVAELEGVELEGDDERPDAQSDALVTEEDLDQFFLWYNTSGTPVVEVLDVFYGNGTFSITLSQDPAGSRGKGSSSTTTIGPNTVGQNTDGKTSTARPALVIPIRMALFDAETHEMLMKERLVVLKDKESRFEFQVADTTKRPVVSLLRGFSAPVVVSPFQSDSDLAFLAMHDTDYYVRHKSTNQLLANEVSRFLNPDARLGKGKKVSPAVYRVFKSLVKRLSEAGVNERGLLAETLSLPKLSQLKNILKPFDPHAAYTVVRAIRKALLRGFEKEIRDAYLALEREEPLTVMPGSDTDAGVSSDAGVLGTATSSTTSVSTYTSTSTYSSTGTSTSTNAPTSTITPTFTVAGTIGEATVQVGADHSVEARGRRSLKNALLRLLLLDESNTYLGVRQLLNKKQSNDESAAMAALSASTNSMDVRVLLSNWLMEHQENDLLVDRWLSAQMTWPNRQCADRYLTLKQVPLYANSTTPNRLRALSRSFANNPLAFHQPIGYKLVADEVLRWDEFNPKLAAGLANAFGELVLVTDELKKAGLQEVKRILQKPNLSKNTIEVMQTIKEKLN
ncbi:aminopeptidase N [Gregarina niphandrodes]|uniref:Aminopeptidase N n=1 Tax=Gregarina niphandrodes TaxID=110365 RepID=A0A023B597_GRENI|nr:aminopeptidase N [Gregarina niphandrodes]EZG59046.1 aminopeptidase N [Gregarina niphandrodes]|eukprot:XP_011130912.1 aminopeptidase N [Gregarina niphandrodes]